MHGFARRNQPVNYCYLGVGLSFCLLFQTFTGCAW